MKKDRAIVFTVSSNLTFAVACIMMDLKRITPNIADEFVIIHDGIKNKDQTLLNSISPCRLILYDFPIKDTSIFNQETLNYFTKMVFAKFECLKLLSEYKNILYLDPDLIIQKDITELFDWCDSGIKMIPSGMKVRVQLHEPVEDYDIEKEGIGAGTFVFQDHLKDYMMMYNFCYDTLAKYANCLYLPEQAIFDFMIQAFNLNIFPIDRKIYSPHPNDKELIENAKIIHAYGQPKFWNGLRNEQWNKNYTVWLEMGGSKYKQASYLQRLVKHLKSRIIF